MIHPLEVASLEILGATTGLVVGRAHVGIDRIDDAATLEWLPILGEARDVAIVRGGESAGVTDSLDTGTLTVTLVNSASPLDDVNVRPNAPIRLVRRAGRQEAVYTSSLPAFDEGSDGWEESTDGGVTWTRATRQVVTVGDETRYGLYPPAGAQLRRTTMVRATDQLIVSWRDQSRAGGTAVYALEVDGVEVEQLTVSTTARARSVTVPGTFDGDVLVTLRRLSGGGRAFLWDMAITRRVPSPVFTGVVADVQLTEDKSGNVFTHLSAVDGMASLGNVQRHGAVVEGGTGFETWAQRINRLRQSAQTLTAAPTPDERTIVYDARTGDAAWSVSAPVFLGRTRAFHRTPWGYLIRNEVTDADPLLPAFDPESITASVVVDGLIPGKPYRLRASIQDVFATSDAHTRPDAWSMELRVRINDDDTFDIDGSEVETPPGRGGTFEPMTFTAGAPGYVQINFRNSRPVPALTERGPYLGLLINVEVSAEPESDYLLCDTMHESSLANHFDIACASVGARWWVDTSDVAQFRRAADRPPVLARFTDARSSDPLDVYYTDVTLSYDTKNATNNVALTNHGRRWETEQGAWAADDRVEVIRDANAVANWGARGATADVTLWTGPGHEFDLTERGYEMLAQVVQPEVRPTSVRFDALASPLALALATGDLDQYSRVEVTRKGTTYACRVVGIEHDITPDRWTVTLNLRKDF